MHSQDDDAKMNKLGQRLRDGWAKQHPVTHQSLQTVQNAVREQHIRDQQAKHSHQKPSDVTRQPALKAKPPGRQP